MRFDLNIPKMGYFILFKHQGGLFGNIIVRKQLQVGFTKEHAQFSHIGVSGGGQWLVNVVPPKTKISDITKEYKGRFIRIVKYKGDNYMEKKRYKIAFWAATNCNLGYDWFGVLSFMFKSLINQHKRLFFCSENAAYALQKEYPEAFKGKSPDKIYPADFCNPKYFETVWEGIIGGN